ncbi:MAG: CvpA family protein [Anaerolineae bacterium]|nr:CvpA family protein [Anaerolineae bacterium]
MRVVVDQALLLNILIAVCAVLGLRRGVARELVVLIGVLVGSVVSPTAAGYVPTVVAFGQKAFGLTKGGAAPSAASVLPGKTGDLAVFGLILLVSIVIARMLQKPPKGITSRFFGAIVGGVNGYLIGRFVFPRLFVEPETMFIVSGVKAQSHFSPGNTAAAVIVFIIVLIGLGIKQSTPPKKKQQA